MNLLRRTMMALGSMTVVALLIALAAPRAAHGIVATLVQVVNTAANPVPTNDVNQPGKLPYEQTILINQSTFACTNFVCTANFNAVPAGHRLVITSASAYYKLGNGGTTATVGLAINGNVFGTTLQLPAPQFIGLNIYTASSPVTFYVEAGDQPSLLLGGQFVANDGNTAQATVVGYLIPTT